MDRIVIRAPGGYEQLEYESVDDLAPGPDDVVLETAAIGINYADCVTRMGLYKSAREFKGYPMTPGFEAAGHIAAVGNNISDLQPGDPVMAVSLFDAYQSQICVPRSQVFPIPDNWSMEQAAALPCAGLTAWFALFELAHPHRGDTLLVHSAAGGVGSALVQLGTIADTRVIGVVGASHKVDAVTALGADAVIDKSTQDLWAAFEALAPAGAEVILDANGASTLRQSWSHLAAPGKLVVYGFHSMLPKSGRRSLLGQLRQAGDGRPNWLQLARSWLQTPRFSPLDMTSSNRSLLAFNLSFITHRQDRLQPAMRQLVDWANDGKLQPPTTTAFAFEDVASAHEVLESGNSIGKLVLVRKND